MSTAAISIDVAALADLPAELVAHRNWIMWRFEHGDKIPRTIDGKNASTTDPATWASYAEVLETFEQAPPRGIAPFSGIGRVFAADDFCSGIDLDDSLDADGNPLPWAAQIIDDFGSYTEISPSGRGVKIWVRGRLNADGTKRTGRKFKYETGVVELYDRARYFTVTGRKLPSAPSEVR